MNLRFVTGVEGYAVFVSRGFGDPQTDKLVISHPRKKEFVTKLHTYWRDHM